ncbi:MAG: hypothetical protein FJZ66_07565 [Bacteroidetes bacterium]|nr:hypothetical protein [Bacteroidota bacterium]
MYEAEDIFVISHLFFSDLFSATRGSSPIAMRSDHSIIRVFPYFIVGVPIRKYALSGS